MRGKWVVIAASAILLAVAAGAISVWRREQAAKRQPPPSRGEPAPPSGEVSLPGRIQARHMVWVHSEVTGRIEELLAAEGEEVYEGQLLARISNQGLETARENAQAALDNAQERINKIEAEIISARLEASRARADATRARAEYDRTDKLHKRQKMLYGEGATPRLVFQRAEKEFEAAKVEFESLEKLASHAEERVGQLLKDLELSKKTLEDKSSQLEDAREDLKSTELRSPATGLVISRQGEVGGEVEAGTEPARIFAIATDLSSLDIALDPEPPVVKVLRPGMSALVIVADVPEPLTGTLREFKGTQAIVEFTSPTPLIKPGMTAQVRIRLE
jgi:multidrug efflux pump subunit AcrA (membrane-fusion protein)